MRVRLSEVFQAVTKVYHQLIRVLAAIGSFSIISIISLTVYDVFMRYVFNLPWVGTYEVTVFLLVVIVFFYMGHVTLTDSHVSIDMFVLKMRPRLRAFFASLSCFLCVVLYVLIVWRTLVFAARMRNVGQVSVLMDIPIYPFLYLVAFGSAIMVLVFITKFIAHVRLVANR
ncbi:MAG: TRAP transporter small permease [Chloroflexota bacterium]